MVTKGEWREGQVSAYPDTIEDLPSTPFWAIVRTTTVHIPGDERSLTNPGHGYPAHDEKSVQVMEIFANENEFKEAMAAAIRAIQRGGLATEVRGFKMIPYAVKTEIVVSVEPNP